MIIQNIKFDPLMKLNTINSVETKMQTRIIQPVFLNEN